MRNSFVKDRTEVKFVRVLYATTSVLVSLYTLSCRRREPPTPEAGVSLMLGAASSKLSAAAPCPFHSLILELFPGHRPDDIPMNQELRSTEWALLFPLKAGLLSLKSSCSLNLAPAGSNPRIKLRRGSSLSDLHSAKLTPINGGLSHLIPF